MTPLEEAVVAQDVAAERLMPVAAAALAAARAGASVPPAAVEAAVQIASKAVLLAIIAALLRQESDSITPISYEIDESTQSLADDSLADLWEHATAAVENRPPPPDTPDPGPSTSPDPTPPSPGELVADDRIVSKSMARSSATRTAAQSVLRTAEMLELPHKVWISRGDPKVRSMHRKLHGRSEELAQPFWKWPTGQTLSYPGDRAAPLDATAGCRCFLWAASSNEKIAEALAPADLDLAFAMAASLEARWA